jgi:hypothetical protein
MLERAFTAWAAFRLLLWIVALFFKKFLEFDSRKDYYNIYLCEFLNFSTSRSTLDLAGRKEAYQGVFHLLNYLIRRI